MAGLPVKRILLVSTAILVVIILGLFFLFSFSQAQTDVNVGVSMTEAQCQTICNELIALGFNVDSCEELESRPKASEYLDNCHDYGACNVTIKGVIICSIQ